MSFANPSILWALFALCIPIIVHLFDFRRYKKVHFSDNYLLLQLLEKNKRQNRLRRLIIMSLRMLFIASLVIAFAKPYFKQKGEHVMHGRLFVSIYIDNSLSMEMSDGKVSMLEKARSKAKEVLNAYPPGTMFRLITNDFSGEHERFCTSDECKDMISLIDFSPVPRQMSKVLFRMADLAETNAAEAEHHFYIISDFQKSTSDISTIVNIDKKLFLFPLDVPKTPNLSVDSVWFNGPVQLENNILTLSVRVKNHSDITLEKIPVRLYVDGKQKGLADAELAASGSDIIDFSFIVNSGGCHEGYVEIDDSPISFDDRYYFAFNIATSIPVYHISGRGATKSINNLFSQDSLFKFISATEGDFDMVAMSSAGLIVLDELSSISSGMASEINQILEGGSNVLIIPSAANIENYRQGFSTMGLPFFNGLDTSNTRVSEIDYDSPLLKGVFVTPPKQIQFPAIFKSYRIPKGSGRSIMTLMNGSVFLLELSKGKGHIYLLSVPLQSSFSTFASNALFVPTVMQMAFSGSVAPCVAYSLDYPYGIDIQAANAMRERPPVLRSFDNEAEFIPGFSSGNPPKIFLTQNISNPGAYKVISEGKTLSAFGLNYTRTESIMDYYTIGEINNITGKNKNISILEKGESTASLIADIQQGTKLWKTFIIIALIFFAIELILLRIWT